MRPSATSSEVRRCRRLGPAGSVRLLAGALLAAALVVAAAPAGAKVFLSQDEALRLAFANCTVARKTVYLTAAQMAAASASAGTPVERALVVRYEATCAGAPGGVAYFDSHRVRTLPETLMVVVAPDETVRRLEVLSFSEPEDYLPRAAWYAQFVGSRLDRELALDRAVRPVTGATLTGRATMDAVRRVLAVHGAVAGAPR